MSSFFRKADAGTPKPDRSQSHRRRSSLSAFFRRKDPEVESSDQEIEMFTMHSRPSIEEPPDAGAAETAEASARDSQTAEPKSPGPRLGKSHVTIVEWQTNENALPVVVGNYNRTLAHLCCGIRQSKFTSKCFSMIVALACLFEMMAVLLLAFILVFRTDGDYEDFFGAGGFSDRHCDQWDVFAAAMLMTVTQSFVVIVFVLLMERDLWRTRIFDFEAIFKIINSVLWGVTLVLIAPCRLYTTIPLVSVVVVKMCLHTWSDALLLPDGVRKLLYFPAVIEWPLVYVIVRFQLAEFEYKVWRVGENFEIYLHQLCSNSALQLTILMAFSAAKKCCLPNRALNLGHKFTLENRLEDCFSDDTVPASSSSAPPQPRAFAFGDEQSARQTAPSPPMRQNSSSQSYPAGSGAESVLEHKNSEEEGPDNRAVV